MMRVLKGVASPILFNLIPKRGNSNTEDRIQIVNRYIKLFGKQTINYLVADREFIGEHWIKYLNFNRIEYHIRIRNNFYCTLNDPRIDWQKMLLSFALQFTRIIKKETQMDENLTRCFVVDDSLLEKSGKTIEGIGRVSNHVKGGFTFGFKLLLLGFFDGKMLIPVDFSLHRESRKNNFGLKAGKTKKSNLGVKTRKGSPGEMRKQELGEKETDMIAKMIKRATRRGLNASYVLMNS